MSEQDYHDSKENVLRRGEAGLPEAVVPLAHRRRRSEAASAKILKIPRAKPESDTEDWPVLVPPGEYNLAYVSDKSFTHPVWKRKVWNISMKIIDPGEHFGKVISYYLNSIPNDQRPTPGWHITSAFIIATSRKPPKDLSRRRPRSFMECCVFRARVKTSKKDSHGVELPEVGHKSKVECLIERISGSPPYLGGAKP